MKRLTTDTPKNNLQASLNLFYIKDHETWVRGGGPEPDFEDVNLSDFIRDVAKKHFPDIEMPESNDDLIFAMAEWLMDGVDEPTGVLALLYTAAWTYSELRRKLMQYEDTGLEPEEIKNALDVNDIIPEINVTVDHIRDLIQSEQDGRLVVLPQGSNCDDCPLCCGGCGGCRITGYPPNPDKCRTIIREEAEAALAGKDSAVPDDPEEPAEPEWKDRMMQTFLRGSDG